MSEKRHPLAKFPPGKANVQWVIWDNAPKKPTVQLRAVWWDKTQQVEKDKRSLFKEELEKLVSTGADAIQFMNNMEAEIERQSSLGADGISFTMPSSLDDDIDF